ncbi:hypothetical protein HDV64DRAFT_165999 [Trichoderma sp. TUCIM 5745]
MFVSSFVLAQSYKAASFPASGQRTRFVQECPSPLVGEGIEKKEKIRQSSLSLAAPGRQLFIAWKSWIGA